MIVWGNDYHDTAGRYDPATDSWRALSRGEDSPSSDRSSTSVVWTGLESEKIVWAGDPYDKLGYRYCAEVVYTWYADDDSDGYGDPLDTVDSRTPPPGYILEGGDCDDGDAAINPGVVEEDPLCDGDCNDDDGALNPGAAEDCEDGIDNDCDGSADLEDFDDCGSSRTVCSTLGNQPEGSKVDEDVWIFSGTTGETVDVLAVATHGMGNANLLLIEAGGGEPDFVEVDRSRLPNRIHVTLPDSGQYAIAVSEQHDVALVSGRRFAGEYCVTLDASMGGSVTLQATSFVEPGDAAAGAQPSVQPGRVPRAMRDPQVGARARGR